MSVVRPCAADSYLNFKATVLDAVRDRIEAMGYTPSEIARHLPSTRAEFVKRFMSGREDGAISVKRTFSLGEAIGVIIEPKIRIDESRAPRREFGKPKARYERLAA